MPIFKIFQRVTYSRSDKALVKESHIQGMDLRHAIQMLPVSEEMKRDLEKKNWTRHHDLKGRTLYLEITEEVKA